MLRVPVPLRVWTATRTSSTNTSTWDGVARTHASLPHGTEYSRRSKWMWASRWTFASRRVTSSYLVFGNGSGAWRSSSANNRPGTRSVVPWMRCEAISF